MKKTIKRAIEVTTRSRNFDRLKAEFYSHDKNNATIELTLDEITAEQVIALFYFTASKRYYQTTAAIEENKIKIAFDTSLITQDESVICFIYFEKVEQSADVHRFAFDVKMSEIDKTRELPIEEKTSRRVVDISDIVTKKEIDALFERLNITGGYDDRPIIERIERLESKPSGTYDDSALKQRLEALEAKTDKDTVYDDTNVKERISALENKPAVDISGLVTKDELASKNYLTTHQDLSSYAKKSEVPQAYDDASIKSRLTQLEQKTDKDTIYDDSDLKRRVSQLEQKPDKDTVYDDSAIKQRLTTLENKPEVDMTPYATNQSVEVVNRTISEMQSTIDFLKVRAEYEIHGTGMPNGKVAAPIGTTYVDEAVTNGALKWIKRTNGGNQGWEVLIGDTGWRTLNITSKLGNSFLKVRRVNSTVTYWFGGLQYGWFGIVRRGSADYVGQGNPERRVRIVAPYSIPEGFRANSSSIGNIYNDNGVIYGVWYLGGKTDASHLRFMFNDPVPTDKDIGDIRVSNISYITDDPWPTVLP